MVKVKDTATKYVKRGACLTCGTAIKSGAKSCADCRKSKAETNRIAKHRRRESLLSRQCKSCGVQMNSNDKRKVKCGLNCPGYKVTVNCIVCGASVVRLKSQIGNFNANCCSNECQRVWAGRCGKGRCGNGQPVDWNGRSAKAKVKWKRLAAKSRSVDSEGYRFWLLCRIGSDTGKARGWKEKCQSVASLVKERFNGMARKEARPRSWVACLIKQRKKISRLACYYSLGDWEWKCRSVATCVRQRKLRKELLQGRCSISKHIELQGQRPKQLQFWA